MAKTVFGMPGVTLPNKKTPEGDNSDAPKQGAATPQQAEQPAQPAAAEQPAPDARPSSAASNKTVFGMPAVAPPATSKSSADATPPHATTAPDGQQDVFGATILGAAPAQVPAASTTSDADAAAEPGAASSPADAANSAPAASESQEQAAPQVDPGADADAPAQTDNTRTILIVCGVIIVAALVFAAVKLLM